MGLGKQRDQLRHFMRQSPALKMVDGLARCRLSPAQQAEFAILCGITSEYVACESHELELMVEKYWRELGVASIWPSDSEHSAQMARIVKSAQTLKSLMENSWNATSIVDADLLEDAGKAGIRDRFNTQKFGSLLDDLILRAAHVRANPGAFSYHYIF